MIDNIEKEKNGNGLDKPLVDLLDTGYPLLQRLREQAPGTYKHSQSLMSLVESISIELGLDIQKYLKKTLFDARVGKKFFFFKKIIFVKIKK